MREVLDEAFDLLSSDIVLAHAKDLDKDVNKGITKLVQKFKKNQEGKK